MAMMEVVVWRWWSSVMEVEVADNVTVMKKSIRDSQICKT
jgi:hypothetical protein